MVPSPTSIIALESHAHPKNGEGLPVSGHVPQHNGKRKMADRKDKINTCMRGFLIFVNSLFMLFGIAIVVGGVYLLTSKWADIDPDLMKKVGAGLIGVGLLALFMACAGCVGAMKKIKCLLITYMMFVFLVSSSLAPKTKYLYGTQHVAFT